MSVLIKGMEMPNKCMECACSGTYEDGLWVCEIEAELLTYTELEDGKPEWCPLVPVPDHGRLIDADALTVQTNQHYAVLEDDWYITVRTIDNAPTIIESEEGE